MDKDDQIRIDREEILGLRSLVDSMIFCLRGLESRSRKELEMIGAMSALGEKAVDMINKHLTTSPTDSR